MYNYENLKVPIPCGVLRIMLIKFSDITNQMNLVKN